MYNIDVKINCLVFGEYTWKFQVFFQSFILMEIHMSHSLHIKQVELCNGPNVLSSDINAICQLKCFT